MIGPKTWDRIVGISLGFSWMAVTAQKISGLFGSLNSGNFALKCMLDMRKCREWAVDRSQNMGPNYGKFFGDFWVVRNSPETVVGYMCGKLRIKS